MSDSRFRYAGFGDVQNTGSEINVAEGLAIVIYESKEKPWEFHHDLSRLL
jgi:hypothetical protein